MPRYEQQTSTITTTTKAHVEIKSLRDFRRFIAPDLDEEDLVPHHDTMEYYFCIDGVCLSAKQDAHKVAYNIVSSRVSLHDNQKKQQQRRRQ